MRHQRWPTKRFRSAHTYLGLAESPHDIIYRRARHDCIIRAKATQRLLPCSKLNKLVIPCSCAGGMKVGVREAIVGSRAACKVGKRRRKIEIRIHPQKCIGLIRIVVLDLRVDVEGRLWFKGFAAQVSNLSSGDQVDVKVASR
jgi:hypothetical protein